MRTLIFILGISTLCLPFATGCGGGSSSSSNPMENAVTVTFTGGTPTAVATQIGTGAFTLATLSGSSLTVMIPSGTQKYAIAYVCPPVPGFGNTVTSESIIEATIADGSAYTISCLGALPTGTATGNVNASAIAGATNVLVRGNGSYGGSVGSASGSFSVSLPNGSNDVALIAVNGSGTVLAVKFVRAQTVPGAINSGNTITLGSSDMVTSQSLNVTNVPSGFTTPPAASVNYLTANGTSILLDSTSATQYPAVPTAAGESGDFYAYESNTTDLATHNSAVGITQTSTSGGAATIALPASWSYSGPAAAALPTFTFNYSGFSGATATAQQGEIEWAPTPATLSTIAVTATSSYQAGASTITVPNLASIAGFFAAAPSGTNIFWVADVYGGTKLPYTFYTAIPTSGSLAFVQNEGNFTEP